MNDEQSGQLTTEWQIPAYARNLLWLDTEAGSARCEGAQGLFELAAPSSELTLRWGGADGAPLIQFRWQPDDLGWAGEVRVGGMVEAIHLTEIPALDDLLAVIFFSAQPLLPAIRPYPDARQRPFATDDFPQYEKGVDDRLSPAIITLITLQDSPLAATAQEAMLQKMPLYAFGQLADEMQGWHEFFSLPILWDSVTLFAP